MAADEMWLRKYRRNLIHATGNGNIHFSESECDSEEEFSPRSKFATGGSTGRKKMPVFKFIPLWKRSVHTYATSSSNISFMPMDVTRCMKRSLIEDRRRLQPPKIANGLLLQATWDNDLDEMRSAFDIGASPDATCYQGNISACHIAALKSYEALSLLLRNNAEKNRVDALGRTPLHFAAWAGNLKSITLLTLPSEAQQENDEVTHEEWCSEIQDENNDDKDIKIPIHCYDDYTHNCRNNELPPIQKGWTPLYAASSNVQLEAVKTLISSGARVTSCDKSGFTPLDVIASSWQSNDINIEDELIKIIMSHGGIFSTSQEIRNKYSSPIHTAMKLKKIEMLKILLDNGAPTNCVDDSGNNIFHVCVLGKSEKCLQCLIDTNYINVSEISKSMNSTNVKGENVLHIALKINWMPGIHAAIKYSDNVVVQANDGNTAIHLAAEIGNIDILDKILSVSNAKKGIDYKNKKGETAICRAVACGHLLCVKRLFKSGANVLRPISGNLTTMHIAAKNGHTEILKFLLSTRLFNGMLNWQTTKMHEGFTALHFAASYNHPECVRLLIAAKANVCVKSNFEPYNACTPLHEAVVKNNTEIVKILIEADRQTLNEIDDFGWTPLHSACFFGSRESIAILLRNGSDIINRTQGPKNFKATGIELIMNNLSKPTEFLADVFDYFIASNDLNFEAPNCLITIDYRIISSSESLGQSKAIKALLATGNRFDQKKLLVHPLVESFVYLKWRSLLPVFYTIVSLYSLFVLSLNIYIVSIYACRDTKTDISLWFHEGFWKHAIYVTGTLISIREILSFKLKWSYFCQLELPINLMTISLAVSLPTYVGGSLKPLDWPRHLSTVALLLSWLQMLLIVSKFPQWGYYVQMFGKVSSIVVKVLLTFSFVVIGFSLSFMIQFHSQIPFDGPWTALIKTMVMMMSEYDYEDLFEGKEKNTHIEVNRILFIIFLVIASIVLMNLLIGVAVNDIQLLELQGNIRRIEKQVEFLASLDAIMENPVVSCFVPSMEIYLRKFYLAGIMIKPDNPNWGAYKSLPQHLRNAIFNKIQSNGLKENIADSKLFKMKLDEICNTLEKYVVAKIDRMEENISAKLKLFDEILYKIDKNKRRERSKLFNPRSEYTI